MAHRTLRPAAALVLAAASLAAAPSAAQAGGATCTSTPARGESFFVAGAPERADIRAEPAGGEPQAGVPLGVRLVVRDAANGCRPVRGARVDLWHANAVGVHSGIAAANTAGLLFLRGRQRTGADGAVTFSTIFPGWYPGRAVHLNYRVTRGSRRFSSQLFLPPSATSAVVATAPYAERGAPPVTNAEDRDYRNGGSRLLAKLTGDVTAGFQATSTIGLGSARPPAVNAELRSTSWIRAAGQRVVAVTIQAGEPISVGLRLTRGGRLLAQRRAPGLPRGRRVVNLIVGPGVSAGGAKLTVAIRDTAGHRDTTTRTVTVPRSG